jgi:hypothetical protein
MSRSLARLGGTLFLLALLGPGVVGAQSPAAALASPEEVLGYPLGRHFTDYAGVREYSRAIAAQSPLIEYRPYGTTPERRELFQLVIASAEHHARLESILAANAELTRAGTTEARAREIAATNPAVVYFSYGVHGNESSSSEAALWTVWDLARGAPEVAGVLDSLVVIVDPVTNPDGRDRYVQWYRSVVGAEPDPSPQSREHREPWPGGRFNHYLFDLNRDWAWMTQPETRARLATWWRWNPQVHVDFHEMSPQSTYFFFPAAAPVNPIYPDHVLAWGRRFGEANARAFDAHGWPYFTGESYDMLYPGYGDSWPSLHGAIGMTYEQAGGGSAGLAFERQAGDTLTLHQRATQHRTSGQATLRTAAAGKTRLLLDFAEAHRTAGAGHPDVLLVPGADPTRIAALVDHLLRQGIEVERADAPFRLDARAYPGYERRRDFPAGTYRVRARQPRGRLAVTLLQPETELRAEYSYDISAWSLPFAYGVEAHQAGSTPRGGWTAASAATPVAGPVAEAAYGYLVPAGDDAAPEVIRFLRAGGTARVLNRPSTQAGREWPAGTWFIPVHGNPSLRERMEGAGLGRVAVPVHTGLSDRGIDLGSANARAVRLPRVALVGGDGVAATSYGAHWYYLEQRLGLPFSALLAADLPRSDLDRFDVVVLPHAAARTLGEEGRTTLGAWVERGGHLVAVAGGAELGAAIAGVEVRKPAEDTTRTGPGRFLTTRQERELEQWTEAVPGAVLQVRLDPGHPLAWGAGADGVADRLFVLHEGDRVFEPQERTETVAFFDTDLRATAGVISARNLGRLEQGAWLLSRPLGQGRVILFADDPLFRLFWRSTQPLYVNALLLGAM